MGNDYGRRHSVAERELDLNTSDGSTTSIARRTLQSMAYATSEARRQLLETLAEATDELGFALACLGEAYDKLDEQNGDRLEEELFHPVQLAYGRGKAAHSDFAKRHGLPGRTFEGQGAGVSATGAAGFIDRAVGAVGQADQTLATLQDSMLPVEAGDAAFRSGLAAVRDLVRGFSANARELLRTLGR